MRRPELIRGHIDGDVTALTRIIIVLIAHLLLQRLRQENTHRPLVRSSTALDTQRLRRLVFEGVIQTKTTVYA